MNKPNKSVSERLLAHLSKGRTITTIQALEKWGCLRIPNRVCELRKEGHHIESISMRANGKNFTKYRMP